MSHSDYFPLGGVGEVEKYAGDLRRGRQSEHHLGKYECGVCDLVQSAVVNSFPGRRGTDIIVEIGY